MGVKVFSSGVVNESKYPFSFSRNFNLCLQRIYNTIASRDISFIGNKRSASFEPETSSVPYLDSKVITLSNAQIFTPKVDPDFLNHLYIISNFFKKQTILKDELNNPYDEVFETQVAASIDFDRENSMDGYLPTKLQQENEILVNSPFFKKSQKHNALKSECGVSFVKEINLER